MMIGQTKKKEQIKTLIEGNKFPLFCVLVGSSGSGKALLSEWIGEQLRCAVEKVDTDVDSIRNMIDKAYSVVSPTLYLILDADNMSVASKNALLKVTEEPPNHARFLMTLVNAENTLPTIRSRATILYMDSYSTDEIVSYYRQLGGNRDEEPYVANYCVVPYDVELLIDYGIKDFADFIQLAIEHVDKVSGSNSFKMAQKIDLGSDNTKYDLALFWKAFRSECLIRMKDQPFKYISGVDITSRYLSDLRIAGVNKQMCFDNWLLDIRKEWMQYAED